MAQKWRKVFNGKSKRNRNETKSGSRWETTRAVFFPNKFWVFTLSWQQINNRPHQAGTLAFLKSESPDWCNPWFDRYLPDATELSGRKSRNSSQV